MFKKLSYHSIVSKSYSFEIPYNTGNDFIYEDDFSQKAEDYAESSGQTDEEGNQLVQNSESNGRFYTDWLNMLYPRLRIAKDLLTDDGVIFISIDDTVAAILKGISPAKFAIYRHNPEEFISKVI